MSPQDVNREFDTPAYRVYFWKEHASRSYELTECHNVREALAWADENAGSGRTYTLYSAVVIGNKRTLIRLYGIDPTKHKGDKELEWPGQVYEE